MRELLELVCYGMNYSVLNSLIGDTVVFKVINNYVSSSSLQGSGHVNILKYHIRQSVYEGL